MTTDISIKEQKEIWAIDPKDGPDWRKSRLEEKMYLLRTSFFKTGIVINRSRLILTKIFNYFFLLLSLAIMFIYSQETDRFSLVMSLAGLVVVGNLPTLLNASAKRLPVEKFDNQNNVVVFDVILINAVLRFVLLAMIIVAFIDRYR